VVLYACGHVEAVTCLKDLHLASLVVLERSLEHNADLNLGVMVRVRGSASFELGQKEL
jgi:hypothetical protein